MKRYLKIIFLLLLLPINLLAVELITGEIKFAGNKYLSDEDLFRVISIAKDQVFSMQLVNNSAKNISQLYRDKGYFHILVPQPKIITTSPQKIDILFNIEERERLEIGAIKIVGNNYLQTPKLPIFKGKYLQDIPGFLKQIVNTYNENGFLFAKAGLESIENLNSTTSVIIRIVEGKYCEFNKFRIKGNKTSQEESIIGISELDQVENLQTKHLLRAEQNLLEKPYIKSAHIIPLNHHELLIDIEEDRMTLFSGVVGFDDSAESKLTGYINMDFLNLFGTDRALSFNWYRLTANSETYNLKYHESGIYQIPINSDLMLYREQADSTYIRSGAEFEIYYLVGNNKLGLYFAKENIIPGFRQDVNKISKRDYTKIGFNWRYDSFDNKSNPSSGYKLDLKYYNIRQKSELDINRNALVSSLGYCANPFSRVVIFANADVRLIENRGLGNMDYWKLGGYKDLRGFMENSFYGYYVGNLNTELRYLISRTSRLFVFGDYGYAENNEYTKDKLWGLGMGIRLETKLGIVGIDYGFGYSDNQWHSPLNGIIHFGIETKL